MWETLLEVQVRLSWSQFALPDTQPTGPYSHPNLASCQGCAPHTHIYLGTVSEDSLRQSYSGLLHDRAVEQ